MTRYFGRKQPADFAFIGLVEEIESSMTQFFQQFELPPVPIPRENTNPRRQAKTYALSLAERMRILELNHLDVGLYQACVAGAAKPHGSRSPRSGTVAAELHGGRGGGAAR
jgi:hypothetical protein